MPQQQLKKKVVIVTGASSDIGKLTATGLAQAGATVVMACPDLAEGGAALSEARSLSGSTQLILLKLDLASQASIRAFVAEFIRGCDRLDVLVCNPDIASRKRTVTADGFDMNFAARHLGPFLLTTLLLPVMELSAPARVIVVAERPRRRAKLNWDDLQSKTQYSMVQAKRQSRLANLLFVRALSGQARGVTANALDPGHTLTGTSRVRPALQRLLACPVFESADTSAQALTYLATSPDVAAVTGTYFTNACDLLTNPLAHDEDAARRLWQISEQLTATSATA